MKIKNKDNKKEFVVDPDDRDLISTANEELNNLDNSKKELVESILELKLSNSVCLCGPDPLLRPSLGSSLKTVLSPKTTAFLLTMIQNHRNINVALDKLDKEKLITKNTSEFVLNLSAKYGSILEDLIRTIDDPHHWAALNISPLVDSKESIDLNVEIIRMDRQTQIFNIDLSESVLISRLFLEKAVDIIELIDKELAMSFLQKDIEKLEELTNKIKDLRKSVELSIKDTEQSEASIEESSPKSEN